MLLWELIVIKCIIFRQAFTIVGGKSKSFENLYFNVLVQINIATKVYVTVMFKMAIT